jgi:DNA-binding MarR family transcriptional regulator
VVNDLILAPAALDVANRLRPVLLHLARDLRHETASFGISGAQAAILHLIRLNPGIGVRELAERERISAPAMSGYVDRLEAAGLADRTRDAHDGRRVGLTVTDEGARVLRAVRRRRTAWLADRLRSLEPAELEAVDGALEPLARLLEVRA